MTKYTQAERDWYTATLVELGGNWRMNTGARFGFVPYTVYGAHIATIWPGDDHTTWDVVVRDLHGQTVSEAPRLPSATEAFRTGADMIAEANGEVPPSEILRRAGH